MNGGYKASAKRSGGNQRHPRSYHCNHYTKYPNTMSQSPSLLSTTTTSHQPTYKGVPCAMFSAPPTSGSFTGEWGFQPQQKQPGQQFLNRITHKIRQQIEYQYTAPDDISRSEKLRYALRVIDIKVEARCYRVYRAAARRLQKP
ncbi:hypothetical protein CCMSSC00406_0002354 [Pleurotus cornucopiae]|uniref:Uncharacterized protein n=1 Tax=Pleurotus cornucopiae TaxID=5321 RepID=A0ACB7J2Q2_PLECO|nr:hypothetical protein CCMSSC00406_0002354 [Pleurotus cornucopiae]